MVTGALVLAGVATAGSIYTSKKAADAQKEANTLQRQQAEMANARARRDEIRKARIAQAAAAINAEGQGVADSSGAAGGQGSIISQGNSNLSFLDRSAAISDQTSRAMGKAISYGNYSQMFGGVASLAMSYASFKASQPKATADKTSTPAVNPATGLPITGQSNF